MGFTVSLLRTQKGHDAIWVVDDRKAIKAIVKTPKQAYLLVDELFHGLLMDIVSDDNSMFTSGFSAQVFKNLKTTLSMSYIDHLQPDGQTPWDMLPS